MTPASAARALARNRLAVLLEPMRTEGLLTSSPA